MLIDYRGIVEWTSYRLQRLLKGRNYLRPTHSNPPSFRVPSSLSRQGELPAASPTELRCKHWDLTPFHTFPAENSPPTKPKAIDISIASFIMAFLSFPSHHHCPRLPSRPTFLSPPPPGK